MKTKLPLLFIALIVFCVGQAHAQSGVKGLFRKYKYEDNVVKLSLPGFVIKMGAGIAKSVVDEPEIKELLKFVKKIGKTKVMVMEDRNPVQRRDLRQMLHQSRKKNNFSDLIQVNEHGTSMNFLIRQQKDKTKKGVFKPGKIKNIILVLNEKDNFVLVSMKTKFTVADLSELIRNLIQMQMEEEKEIIPKKDPANRPQV